MNNTIKTDNPSSVELARRGLKRRYSAERRFRLYGRVAIALALLFLGALTYSIVSTGWRAFQQTYIALDVAFDKTLMDANQEGAGHFSGDFHGLVKRALRELFPDVKKRKEKRSLYRLVSANAAYQLRDLVKANPGLIGTRGTVWLAADDDVDQLIKGYIKDRSTPESARRLNNQQMAWVEQLTSQDRIEKRFNHTLFSAGDSREPEMAGIRGAAVGSMYVILVTLLLAFPLGIAAAIYLEEFAQRNRLTSLIEININNLAAVPSIVFGLLGLAVFIGFFGLPRSAPVVGGLVLTLMTLPTIIITSRAALGAVPPSVRDAAMALGASRVQVVFHHVLPLAIPGMLTGAIIGMARALGETAPLLMIGMVAFIADIPNTPFDPATALPVQIYLWVDSPERAFVERTSAAIMVLLALLILMNGLAVYLRRRFEQRW